VRGLLKFVVLFVASAPVLFVCWVVFVGKFAEQEMLIGMAVAVVSAFAICVVEYANEAHFRPRMRDIAQSVFIPWVVVQDTCLIFWVALRDLVGGKKAESDFRVAVFETGDLHDANDTGRRVIAVTYMTISPNSIVMGINTLERRMLFHQIQKKSVPTMTKNLGAEA
jgi:multisubunit Na+/H+ antiporter MnhE subunit